MLAILAKLYQKSYPIIYGESLQGISPLDYRLTFFATLFFTNDISQTFACM